MNNNSAAIAQAFANKNILIVGDVMIDAYMWGNVTRISPEAPVPIVAIERREQRLGGAANVALNLLSLGANPIICSVLGNDDHGREFASIMYSKGMDKRGLLQSDDRITTIKSRVIGNNMHIVRIDEEDTHPLNEYDEGRLLKRIDRIMKDVKVDAVIFQDYDKGCLTPHLIEHVTSIANKGNIITTVDPKHRNFSQFRGVTLFKPNLREMREGLNLDFDEDNFEVLRQTLDQAATTLHEHQHIDIVLITLSNKGIYACDFRSDVPQSLLLPACVRSVSDVSGAGDTVISVASLALSAGLSLEEIVTYANLAGGIVCEQVGVVPIDKERLLSEISAL
ncbi:MAG: hypothetical protein IJV22_03885 [Bacteroidales bacterium]|nr:hypothetical protein [Bacteroidales bacterium]